MIVAGFGFRASATLTSLRSALSQTGWETKVSALAAPADKAHAAPLQRLAKRLQVPVHPVSDVHMQAMVTKTQSDVSLARRGTGSVAEACALAVAGPEADLTVTRRVSEDHLATCSIAKGNPQ